MTRLVSAIFALSLAMTVLTGSARAASVEDGGCNVQKHPNGCHHHPKAPKAPKPHKSRGTF